MVKKSWEGSQGSHSLYETLMSESCICTINLASHEKMAHIWS